jgi:hypothetical protein
MKAWRSPYGVWHHCRSIETARKYQYDVTLCGRNIGKATYDLPDGEVLEGRECKTCMALAARRYRIGEKVAR